MPNFMQLVSLMREQMNATLSRSDVLKPLAWLVGLLSLAIVLMLVAKAPEWVLSPLVWTLVGSILLYAFSYIYCLFVDRDALRSEKYSLNKMAIEHGLLGDSRSGLFESDEVVTAVSHDETKQLEHRK
ncbi:MAG TPA: hypothetical protein VNR39_12935 [Pseudolabrys sp.]|nr:hypothetical protein [Pseudolabrys sp.]